MSLLAVLDAKAHEALDESLKTLYVQNTENKNFYLDLPQAEAEKLAFDLNSKFENKKKELTAKHTELNELKAQIETYKKIGKTPEEIAELIESKRPEEINTLIANHKTEIETLRKSYEEPMEAMKAEAEAIRKQIENLRTQTAIQKARNEFDLNETADYVLRDFIKVVPKEEGSSEYVEKVFENGQEMLVAGQPQTIAGLIKSFQEQKKFSAMFNAGSGAGAGVTNHGTSGSNGKVMKRSEWEAKESAQPGSTTKFFTEGGTLID